MQRKGKLYLIPTPLGAEGSHALPDYVTNIIQQLDIFIVEKAKTARHFVKSMQPVKPISALTFLELNKRTTESEWRNYLSATEAGKDIGLLSEAGCPGIADPGAVIVNIAHQKGITVVPMVGPSSILLALIASGMQGQRFAFHGYLSPKRELVGKDLKRLEQLAKKYHQTQIFIETPYRNQQLVEQALKVLRPDTNFCIAIDLTLPQEWILSQSIAKWKSQDLPNLRKRPAVFLIFGSLRR